MLIELRRRRGLRQKLPVWGCFEHIAVEVSFLKVAALSCTYQRGCLRARYSLTTQAPRMQAKGLGLRLMERVVAARTRLLSLPYGGAMPICKSVLPNVMHTYHRALRCSTAMRLHPRVSRNALTRGTRCVAHCVPVV